MENLSKAKLFFEQVLHAAVKNRASDIHLKNGVMPVIRKHGKLRPLSAEIPRLSADNILQICQSIMNEDQWQSLQKNKDCDMAYEIEGLGRFRINAFFETGSPRMVIRVIS
ncbi:MAG: type IV pili twitching motility protein PilT, partial [Deltaproteobacteria bacterium]|nr:type IV pili twitching motility protein PilT [Deltaproteobacteria bacterium]